MRLRSLKPRSTEAIGEKKGDGKREKIQMKFIANGMVNESGIISVEGGSYGGESGRQVVVGMKLDQRSRELLTWTLVKIAHPGDRVLALHVLEDSTEEQSTLLGLVQTFDTVIGVYGGFCHLKQVDLKMKVARGSDVRKNLVREAKRYDGAIVIVGTSTANHRIRSKASMAKYCARKLSRDFSVFAVDNGKVVFSREGIPSASSRPRVSNVTESDGRTSIESRLACGRGSSLRRYFSCSPAVRWRNYDSDEFEEPNAVRDEDSSLPLVPYQRRELSSGQEACNLKRGWLFVQWMLLPRPRKAEKGSIRTTSPVCSLQEPPSNQSLMAVHPIDIQSNSPVGKDGQLSGLNEHSGAIVPLFSYAPTDEEPNSFPKELEGFPEKYSSTCRLFTYQELASATSNFAPERMIGKGGSSQVFRGSFPDGKELAVKILKQSEDVLRDFAAEVEIITEINHKNIISLFGFCLEDSNPVLVYEFLSRGSLEESLHGHKKDPTAFGWEERYKVAEGIAEALNHLHNVCSQPVIHRDVKSSNILLSDEFEPQLADFGLASRVSEASSCTVSTDFAGTFGYLAPEYFLSGKVTDKIDVYAFGVVLLELLSGRRPIDGESPKGEESLVLWARPILKDGKTTKLLDPSPSSDHHWDKIERMVLAATLCIIGDPRFRPGISHILKLLLGDVEVTNWAKQHAKSMLADSDVVDEEETPADIQSLLNVAFLDLEDDSVSDCSIEQNVSLEEYLKGRWSRVPSFD